MQRDEKLKTPEPDRERTIQLVMALLALPGGSGQEGQVMEYIRQRLLEAGAPASALRFDQAHRRCPWGGEIGNLVLRLPGNSTGPSRLLMAHADTVPICRGAVPVLRGPWIVPASSNTGLGADDRAGTAIVLNTALEILTRRLPHPPLTFLWTVQEEVGLYGARHATLGLLGKPRLAFNFDGGPMNKLVVGATGGYRIKLRIGGRASHAGMAPEQGVSAIVIAAKAIAQLETEGWLGRIQKPAGEGTSNVGVIHGGEATNVVTPDVEIRAEARSHDPKFRRQIVRAIQQAFQTAARTTRSAGGICGKVRFEGRLDYEAFAIARDEPCLLAAEAAVRSIGGKPEHAISNGGLDANWMVVHGIPTVTLGTGQSNAHTPRERLRIDEYFRGCRVALRLATAECGAP